MLIKNKSTKKSKAICVSFIALLILFSGYSNADTHKVLTPKSLIQVPETLKSKVSVMIINTKNDHVVFSYKPHDPRLMASNIKLLTSSLALKILHPDFKWHTKSFFTGVVHDHILEGDVYIEGGGDPTFDTGDLYSLIVPLKHMGVNRINGNIIINEHIYNSEPKYSMLETMPYDSDTITPHGFMINADEARVTLHIFDSDVKVTSNLVGYALENNLQVDTKQATCNNLYKQITVKVDDTDITLKGKIAKACNGTTLVYKILNNQQNVLMNLKSMLSDLGITLNGKYHFSSNTYFIPKSAILLNDHSSLSLAQVLYTMNHYSVNLIAESLLLSLGAYTTDNHNTYSQSTAIYLDYLRRYNLIKPDPKFNASAKTSLPEKYFQLENGAGLSRTEYFTATSMAHLLQLMNSSPLQPTFAASLPMAGESGTLEKRFASFGDRAQFKTGTLNDTRSYSGYFYSKNGTKYIVVVTGNNLDTKSHGAYTEHDLFEQFVTQVLTQLN